MYEADEFQGSKFIPTPPKMQSKQNKIHNFHSMSINPLKLDPVDIRYINVH